MTDDLIRLGLVDDDEIVLDDAALTLALLDHAGIDIEPYRERIVQIADRLGSVGGEAEDAHAQADALSHVLAGAFGFTGDTDRYDHPDNADLIRVLDRRRGLSVSLAILYVAAARRLGWTANVLDVPGHVLVLIGGDAAPVIPDPFRQGIFIGSDRIAAMAIASRTGAAAVHPVRAMPNRVILVRLLFKQASRAEQTGQGRRTLTLYRRMTSAAPAYAHGWWERARLERIDGDGAAARASRGAMLEITRDPALRERIAEVLASLTSG